MTETAARQVRLLEDTFQLFSDDGATTGDDGVP